MPKLPYVFAAAVLAVLSLHAFAGCGSESDSGIADPDGSADAFIDAIIDGRRGDVADCKPEGQTCAGSADCCSANCANGSCTPPLVQECKAPGAACAAGPECCTVSCIGGTCANKQCVADNQACGKNEECCGGSCIPDGTGGGVCKPLNTTCRTAGNPCAGPGECCSALCNNGLCAEPSFCAQEKEVCATSADCCGGNCVKAGGAALGTCGSTVSAPGATNCTPKGVVCATGDQAVPDCGGSCCSRVCAPTGAAPGFKICQPPSGCAPTGEICRADSDCCGWSGAPPPVKGAVECSKASPTQEFGRCNNGNSCREPGSICKPSTESCNAENNCCEPNGAPSAAWCNSNPDNCCRKDALGIPRCIMNANDCSAPVPAGTSCATSADCCGLPCVGNKCLAACVPTTGACTTSADCCVGLACNVPVGASTGTCGAGPAPGNDAGTNPPGCALYGQTCNGSGDCCDGVPCTSGRCRYP